MILASTQERKSSPKPFQNSLSALAHVALHETGAEGYAFFRRLPESGELARHTAYGADITEESTIHTPANVVAYQLGGDGVLAFAFRDAERPREIRAQLDRMAAAIESVWSAAQTTVRYSELATHVADLESRLLDARISDRVRGFLGNHGSPDAFEAIVRHVEGVLNPKTGRRTLEKLSEELEEQVEERRLANRAKAILQIVHGMSEEQAHIHLRRTSRRTRRRVRDIALDLIQSYPAQALPSQRC